MLSSPRALALSCSHALMLSGSPAVMPSCSRASKLSYRKESGNALLFIIWLLVLPVLARTGSGDRAPVAAGRPFLEIKVLPS